MTFFQWRRFHFFDLTKDVDKGQLETIAKSDCKITSTSCGRGHLILGDSDGNLHFLNRHLSCLQSVKAFNVKVSLVQQLRQSGILLTIGEDDPGVNPYLKVLDLDKPDKSGNPSIVRVSRVPSPGGTGTNTSSPVLAFSAHENLNLLAFGFENGCVILQRGDVTRERGVKTKILMEGDAPITGLCFKISNKCLYLYASTLSRSLVFDVTVKDKETKSDLDTVGCKVGLAVATENTPNTHFVTGLNNGIYCYNPEGRGQCYAFEGDKVALHWFRGYLVVVSSEALTPSAEEAGEGGNSSPNGGGPPLDKSLNKKHVLTIFDVENRFVAYTAPIRPIHALLSEWGSLFALTEDNRLFQLTEKDIRSKLEILFKKNNYDIAVKIAKSQHYNEEGLKDIFRQYGDHLYSKNDFDGAIENYIKTIGFLEPSYIIRKFLDAHKIQHLTQYLQALHTGSLANEDHTTLLINCYTKLKDQKKLDEFTGAGGGGKINSSSGKGIEYDVDIVIKVCRQAGYSQAALKLSEEHAKHDWHLRIQIEDVKNFKGALEYIAKLPLEQAEASLKKYGHALIKELPGELCSLLQSLCTDYKPSDQPLVSEADLNQQEDSGSLEDKSIRQAAHPEEFLNILVSNPKEMVEFLEFMIKNRKDLSKEIFNTLLNYYLHEYKATDADSSSRLAQETKILTFMRLHCDEYDNDQAMILCSSNEFAPGTAYIYEKREMYGEILRDHLNRNDLTSGLKTCRTFGPQKPDLWIQALQAVCLSVTATEEQLMEIIDEVEELRLLSPIQIIDMMEMSDNVTMETAGNWVISVFKREDARIKEDQEFIAVYQEETDKLREEVVELRRNDTVFSTSQCGACNHPIENPSVHFGCQHSYHQHCFKSYSDTDDSCPACITKNEKIYDILDSQSKKIAQEDEFHQRMETAEDKFAVVSEYMGLGVFKANAGSASGLGSSAKEARKAATRSPYQSLTTGPGAEARLRSDMGAHRHKPAMESQPSEARLRSGDTRAAARSALASEGRLRADAGSEAEVGRALSDARIRQREGGSSREMAGSLESHLHRERGSSGSPRLPAPSRVPFQPPSPQPDPPQTREHNPFGSPANPFGDQDDEDLSPDNPFAAEANQRQSSKREEDREGEDYDESLNPFAAS